MRRGFWSTCRPKCRLLCHRRILRLGRVGIGRPRWRWFFFFVVVNGKLDFSVTSSDTDGVVVANDVADGAKDPDGGCVLDIFGFGGSVSVGPGNWDAIAVLDSDDDAVADAVAGTSGDTDAVGVALRLSFAVSDADSFADAITVAEDVLYSVAVATASTVPTSLLFLLFSYTSWAMASQQALPLPFRMLTKPPTSLLTQFSTRMPTQAVL